jgi:enoyl-CoA hydratase/long-chain 3-hydroxyacyl-CoA dehydrogenase
MLFANFKFLTNEYIFISQILEVIKTGLAKGPAAGYKAEAEGFGELAVTKECKGLISLFQGQTECKKSTYGNPKRPAKYDFEI